jgi:hypothetical protein
VERFVLNALARARVIDLETSGSTLVDASESREKKFKSAEDNPECFRGYRRPPLHRSSKSAAGTPKAFARRAG